MNPTQEIAEIRAILREVAENQTKTEAQMKRTDRKLESLISNWGQLVESLSEVGLIEELARYGVTGLRESLHNLEIKDAQNQIIKEFDRILID